jgi:hypothetical protein
MDINKNYFVYYRDEECCLKIFENTNRGFIGFMNESDYNERFNQLMNLPIEMKKIHINIYAGAFIIYSLNKYKKQLDNLPFGLEELNINVYIPNKCNLFYEFLCNKITFYKFIVFVKNNNKKYTCVQIYKQLYFINLYL